MICCCPSSELASIRAENNLGPLSIATWAMLCCGYVNVQAQTWDVLPTPLDVMQEAGVARDRQSIQAALFDSDRDPELRFQSALALAQLEDRASVPVLIKAIDESEIRVRQGAMIALTYMPSIDAIPNLCSVVHSASDSDSHLYAIGALSQTESSFATQCIVDAATNENETIPTRRQALHALWEIKTDVESVDALVPLLESPETSLRALAALCLNRSYYQSETIHKSLGITDALVSSVLDRELFLNIYFDAIEALEDISGETFIDDSLSAKELVYFIEINRDRISEDVLTWSESLER